MFLWYNESENKKFTHKLLSDKFESDYEVTDDSFGGKWKDCFFENGYVYAFDAHGEIHRPSIMPAVSVGGMHLSDRGDGAALEKHTAIQDVAVGNGMAAWYIQEFLPDGADYKLSKKVFVPHRMHFFDSETE